MLKQTKDLLKALSGYEVYRFDEAVLVFTSDRSEPLSIRKAQLDLSGALLARDEDDTLLLVTPNHGGVIAALYERLTQLRQEQAVSRFIELQGKLTGMKEKGERYDMKPIDVYGAEGRICCIKGVWIDSKGAIAIYQVKGVNIVITEAESGTEANSYIIARLWHTLCEKDRAACAV